MKISTIPEKARTFVNLADALEELQNLTNEVKNTFDNQVAEDRVMDYADGRYTQAECNRFQEAGELVSQATYAITMAINTLMDRTPFEQGTNQ